MKHIILKALTTLVFSSTAAFAQEAKGIDETVNEVFASVTGPFVSLILRPCRAPVFPGS